MSKKILLFIAVIVIVVIFIGKIFFINQEPDKNFTLGHTATATSTKTAMLAGGCFWCVEADMEKVPGVVNVISGYAGGETQNPTYENYSAGGHREVVLVTYDDSIVDYAKLVETVITHSDPTDPDGSFYDRGVEYAPAVYYLNSEEKLIAQEVINRIDSMKVYEKPIAVKVLPIPKFWPAEEYHQDYYKKNSLKYSYYRLRSGRDAFIKKYWGKKQNELNEYKKPSDEYLRATLTPIQYEVTQKGGTEKPFVNEYDKNKAAGIYVDIVSGEALFSSRDKYDSGTGWPSFVKPITLQSVVLRPDDGIFIKRTEVRSFTGDSHLGHVFDDGPVDRGGKRYCINSAALRFVPKDHMIEEGYEDYLKFVE